MWRRPRPHDAVATSAGGGGGGGGETAGAWSSHASAAAAAVQDTTARVVRTGAGRLCVAPAPAAASSHQSDVSRRDADIGSAGGGAAAAGGGGGGEAAGASPSRASAAAGECRRELGSFFYEGSWAVGRGDRGGDGGGRREPDGKTGSGDRGQARSGARAHSGMEWLIPYLGYSIDLIYIFIYMSEGARGATT